MPWRILLASFVTFAILAAFASGSGILPGDTPILDLIQDLPRRPSHVITDIGNVLGTTAAGPVALIALAALAAGRRTVEAVAFCLTLLALRLVAMIFKSFFESPRPDPDSASIRHHFDYWGFPSGHALTATVIAGAIAIVLPHLNLNTRFTKPATILVWLWALACGFARVWDGAHWPSDVLGGFLAGIVLIGSSTYIAKFFVAYRLPTK